MKLFTRLNASMMTWARHPRAGYYLGGVSFAESSFFPVPPDVLLVPMAMARPDRAWWFAFLTTVTSVAGGVLGYFIGAFAFEYIEPWLQASSYWPEFETTRAWFGQWGVWVIFVTGFSPIPYKLFTITAGVLSLGMLPFVLASFVGRGARFFLVAGLLKYVGPRVGPWARKYVEWIGWATVFALVIIFVYLRYS